MPRSFESPFLYDGRNLAIKRQADKQSDTSSPELPPHRRLPHDDQWLGGPWKSRLRKRLFAWYADNARSIPWRSDPQPYHIWISEIMCQQTQVATVIPYFERFMKSFPTIGVLAAADEQELMKHWEGLGYYRRARSIHAAAKLIVDQHDGAFPLDFDDVLALPGIGRYTAGAILSISDGQRHPILEGNTQRVFSRLIGLGASPTETAANKLLWEVSEALLPQKNVGVFNQAAMEIGALVCKPQQPQCDSCPLARLCAANREGTQAEIPGKMKRMKYVDKTEFAFVVGGPKVGYLMRPLPAGGRWAGLWDFPRTTEDSISELDDAADWISTQLGIRTVAGVRLKSIRHAVTKYRISLHVHEAKLKPKASGAGRVPKPWRYVSAGEFADLPLSVTGRKIADSLLSETQQTLPLSD